MKPFKYKRKNMTINIKQQIEQDKKKTIIYNIKMQNKKGIILIMLVCVCVLGVSIAAWYILNRDNNTNNPSSNNTDDLNNEDINYALDALTNLKRELGFGGRFQ